MGADNVGHIGEGDTDGIQWFFLCSNFLGGLALSLYGLSLTSKGLKGLLGEQLREAIRSCCGNRFSGFATGTVATALLSSSTATSLLVVSFVESGDMTFEQSLGVTLGINVGSTVAAQLVALKLTRYALAFVAAGYGLMSCKFGFEQPKTGQSNGPGPRQYALGESLFGLGLLFFGMDTMGVAMGPLQTYPPFLNFLVRSVIHG